MLGRPAHIVGHSYGGAVALQFASRHPRHLKSLTLIEPASFHLLRDGDGIDEQAFREISETGATVVNALNCGDYQGGMWSVAGLDRAGAHLVSTVEGRPAFGGTPSDQSIRDLIAEIKSRGLKVTLYPFLMLDIPVGNTLSDPLSGAMSQPAYPCEGYSINVV